MEIKFTDHKDFAYTWRNRGRLAADIEAKPITMTDAMSSPDARTFFPQAIEYMVRESVEPLMVISNLMTRMAYTPGQMITLPSLGASGAADIIPEGGEYPEMSLHTGAGQKIATVGKYGVAFKMTEEMVRYSQWDVFNLCVRACANDMARLKEQNAVNMLLNQGVTAFDNVTPASSIKGVTTGRKVDGTGNGSVTMDDIFDAYGIGLENGFRLDTIIMHPLTWIMWVKDPVLRSFVYENGGGTLFAGWQGDVTGGQLFSNGILGAMGSPQLAPVTTSGGTPDYHPTRSSAPQLPSYLNLPFRIIVSPFATYNPSTKLTDIIMFASGNAGALLVDEEMTMQEVPDNLRDMKKVKFRERYAFMELNEGNGIVNLKNVHVVHNEIANSPLVQKTVSVTLEDLSGTPNVLD